MKTWLPILLSFALLAMPAALAKAAATGDQDGAQSQSTQADSQAAPAGDVGNTLDKLLSRPIDEAPTQPPATGTDVQPSPATSGSTPPVSGGEAQPYPVTSGAGPAEKDANGASTPGYPPGAQQADQSIPGYRALSRPTSPTLLRGQAEITGIQAQENGNMLNGQAQDGGNALRGQAQDDPDVSDRELMVEWDRWRNRLLHFIQMQVQANVNSDPRPRRRHFDPLTGQMIVQPPYPMGIVSWFDCQVSSDRRILSVQITQSSGFPDYDRAVLDGIRALDGTSILQFPRGSHRPSVRQEAGIETATSGGTPAFQFGDIERYLQRMGY